MRSTMSAFVMVIGTGSSAPELEREAALQVLERRAVQRVHLVVGEAPVGGAIGDGVGEALSAARDGRTAIAVEEPHRFDLRIAQRPDLLDDVPGVKRLVDDHGEVARDGGKAW